MFRTVELHDGVGIDLNFRTLLWSLIGRLLQLDATPSDANGLCTDRLADGRVWYNPAKAQRAGRRQEEKRLPH